MVFIVVTLFYVFTVFILTFFTIRFINYCRKPSKKTVGFFHPYCNAGGGGERVLWCAIRSLHKKYPGYQFIVYTGDIEADPAKIKNNAKDVFNIVLPGDLQIEFVYLNLRHFVEAKKYPYFTLIGQSLGSMILGFEALYKYVPDVFIDSMGYAFTYPIFKYLAGCKVATYVHYPTISIDMLNVVKDRTGSFNNRSFIANSKILTNGKLMYYHIFAALYGLVGKCADKVMVNSSWTKNHIKVLWKSSKPVIVYPPCDITEFLKIPNNKSNSQNIAVSIGQFRPEKNHALQIEAFAAFLSGVAKEKRCNYTFILMGGCRNDGDKQRVEKLQSLAVELGIKDNIKIQSNISFKDLKYNLSQAKVGIHTMSNEHFGIGVVEFQAAGVIALAHKSGGPLMDIVIDTEVNGTPHKTGYLASTVEEYSEKFTEIFSLSQSKYNEISEAAKISCLRFCEEYFESDFLMQLEPLLV